MLGKVMLLCFRQFAGVGKERKGSVPPEGDWTSESGRCREGDVESRKPLSDSPRWSQSVHKLLGNKQYCQNRGMANRKVVITEFM